MATGLAQRALEGEGSPLVLPLDGEALNPRSAVFRFLWARGEISRADVAKLSGLSRSTVSAAVSELLSAGLVEERGAGDSNGGRKPIILRFLADARVCLGLDVGASHVGAVLTDLRGKILRRDAARIDARHEPKKALPMLLEMGHSVLEGWEERLLGVGVALPAPVDPASRKPHPAILPAWQGLDPATRVEAAFGRPVRVENDANLGALAERWWGHRGPGDLVFVKVATGIGAGIMIGGRILTGANGFAGELGHLSVDPNGPPCMCGGQGCLNVLIGTPALVERARARLPHFPDSLLHGGAVDMDGLVAAARKDDPLAVEIMEYVGERLGEGLGNLLNVLDPSVLVVGGDLTLAGEVLLRPLRRAIAKRTFGDPAQRVVRSQIDEQSVALGAATAILQAAIEAEEIPLFAREGETS